MLLGEIAVGTEQALQLATSIQPTTNSILIGVVTGILTSALLYGATQVFQRIIVPWCERLLYSGVEIAGEWEATETPFPQAIRMSLKQHAGVLSGTVTYQNADSENGAKEMLRVFAATGDLSDRFVCLRLRHRGRRRIGVIHYLLEVVGDGRTMRGVASFYDLRGEKVAAGAIAFRLTGAEPLQ